MITSPRRWPPSTARGRSARTLSASCPSSSSRAPGPAYRAQLPRSYLAFGFTTLVDADLREETRAWFEAAPLHPRLSWSLPASIIAHLRSAAGEASLRALAKEYDDAARSISETAGAAALIDVGNARAIATARLMAESGITLILGSDTPSGDGIGNPPGLNGRLELQHWADAGIPLRRILRAATLDNALAFGLARGLGSIEVGKRADMLLLGANPLDDIAAYDAIAIVFVGGEAIRRETLRAAQRR